MANYNSDAIMCGETDLCAIAPCVCYLDVKKTIPSVSVKKTIIPLSASRSGSSSIACGVAAPVAAPVLVGCAFTFFWKTNANAIVVLR